MTPFLNCFLLKLKPKEKKKKPETGKKEKEKADNQHRMLAGRINDGLVRWVCVYAAQRWLCAGAIFAALFFCLVYHTIFYVD